MAYNTIFSMLLTIIIFFNRFLTRRKASGFDLADRVRGGTISSTKLLSLINGGKTLA